MSKEESIKNIEIRYFHGHNTLPGLDLKNNTQFPYSKEKRNELIDTIIEAGYNVMIQTIIPSVPEGYQVIWIDKYRFQPR